VLLLLLATGAQVRAQEWNEAPETYDLWNQNRNADFSVASGNSDVILVMGQSNAIGKAFRIEPGTPVGEGAEEWRPSIVTMTYTRLYYDANATAVDLDYSTYAFDTLMHAGMMKGHPERYTSADGLWSWVMPFVRLYRKRFLPAWGRRVLVIPAARGGCAFECKTDPTRSLAPGSILDVNAQTMWKYALAANSTNKPALILWLQGESDTRCDQSSAQYAKHLGALIERFRDPAKFNAFPTTHVERTPFMVLPMNPAWVGNDTARLRIARVHDHVESFFEDTIGFPDKSGLSSGLTEDEGNVHYSTLGMMHKIAERAFGYYATYRARVEAEEEALRRGDCAD
jgi:hypothetical protein